MKITVSVSGVEEKTYPKLRGRAGRNNQGFSEFWAEEMERVGDGGLTGTELAAIATEQDAEITELKQRLENAMLEAEQIRAIDAMLTHDKGVYFVLEDGATKIEIDDGGDDEFSIKTSSLGTAIFEAAIRLGFTVPKNVKAEQSAFDDLYAGPVAVSGPEGEIR